MSKKPTKISAQHTKSEKGSSGSREDRQDHRDSHSDAGRLSQRWQLSL